MARLTRKAVVFVSVLLVASFLVAAAQPTSQSFPSQEVPPAGKPRSGFYFPEQLRLFAALEADASGVLQGVSDLNFTMANASLANYSAVVNEFYAESNGSLAQIYGYTVPGSPTVFSAMSTSEALYNQLIVKSKSYEALYAASTQGENSLTENQLVQNGVVMRGLNADIKALRGQIKATSGGIFSPAIDEGGLDLTDYTRAQATLDSFVARLDGQLTNVTDVAFQNTTTTIVVDRSVAHYPDYVHISGIVNDTQGGVANATVAIWMGGGPIATVQTNASGGYSYDFFVDCLLPTQWGQHDLSAHFEPTDKPLKASTSSVAPLLVENVTVTNALHVSSSSLLGGINLAGNLTTDRAPVKNASVALYVDSGNESRAWAETDANGSYSMTYRLAPAEYLGVLFSPTEKTFYTVFPLSKAQSDVITVPLVGTPIAAFFGSSVGIATTVTVLFVAAIAVYMRVSQRAIRRPAARITVLDAETPLLDELKESTPISLVSDAAEMTHETYHNVEDFLSQAKEFFDARDNNGAIIVAYRGALALIAREEKIALKPSLSHWELYAIIEGRLTDVRAFRDLTHLYELASYSGREMTEQRAQLAFNDLKAIDSLVRSTGGET